MRAAKRRRMSSSRRFPFGRRRLVSWAIWTRTSMISSQNVDVAGILAVVSAFDWSLAQRVSPTTRATSVGLFVISVLAKESVASVVGSARIWPRA